MPHQARLLRLLIENVRDYALILLDAHGCVSLWNPGAENLLGWPQAHIVGQPAAVLFTPEDRQAGIVQQLLSAAQAQGSVENERWFVRKDASLFWGGALMQPVQDGGVLHGYALILRDLSLQRQADERLRASEARLRALADNMAQLAWMADAQGSIFWYNRRWYEYTGTTPAQMQGGGWQRVHDPHALPQVLQRWQACIGSGEPFDMVFPIKGEDSVFRPFLTRVNPICDALGQIEVWFGTNTDITEQQEAEQHLRQHQAEVEALNVRLARAMQETHHRVKNNLQVISALLEMEEINSEASGTQGAAFARVKQHTQALALIHEMLTAQAKEDAAAAPAVSARSILGKLLPLIEHASGGRAVAAQIEDMLLPVQKATALALLVNECVSNAIKHGKGEIGIRLHLGEPQPPDMQRQARLEVWDDGPGLPPGFDPQRAANTGLELIESAARWDLRGQVRYENRQEGGVRVVVTFPIDTPAPNGS